jgi:CRISPR-associated protein Csc2
VRPYEIIQRQVKFNVIDEATQTSGTITEYDYTIPGVFLPSVVTTVDLTVDEFTYILGNILKTSRYGKESSRQGYIRNHMLAIAFSDVELFSNLEFTQACYDAFCESGIDLAIEALALNHFREIIPKVVEKLTAQITGRLKWVVRKDLEQVLLEARSLYGNESRMADFLKSLNTRSASFTVK